MATTAIQNASTIQANYMKLLVAQLQNQNPLEPMNNDQMASQLAQLSQLQQMETMNSTFSKVLASQQLSQATALIGKAVAYLPEGSDTAVWARVTGSGIVAGEAVVQAGQRTLTLDQIQAIAD
ncbi:MAG: flagellar hook capping FlgD N-terminal domain-containing protein [Planctomycetaceae bacterium]